MEQLQFRNARGEILTSRLDVPTDRDICAYALFAHCFTCGKDFKPANRIADSMTRVGIAVLRFDFTGIGHSAGDFADTNFSTNVSDILCAVDYMRRQLKPPAIMLGHSLGGTAIMAAAGDVPECRAVATINSPSNAVNVTKQFSDHIETIERDGQADVKLAGRPFTIKKQFLDDVRNQSILKEVAELKKALLILHSPVDNIVSIDHAANIFEAAKHPKSFVSLDKGDHLLLNDGAAEYAGDIIAAYGALHAHRE